MIHYYSCVCVREPLPEATMTHKRWAKGVLPRGNEQLSNWPLNVKPTSTTCWRSLADFISKMQCDIICQVAPAVGIHFDWSQRTVRLTSTTNPSSCSQNSHIVLFSFNAPEPHRKQTRWIALSMSPSDESLPACTACLDQLGRLRLSFAVDYRYWKRKPLCFGSLLQTPIERAAFR